MKKYKSVLQQTGPKKTCLLRPRELRCHSILSVFWCQRWWLRPDCACSISKYFKLQSLGHELTITSKGQECRGWSKIITSICKCSYLDVSVQQKPQCFHTNTLRTENQWLGMERCYIIFCKEATWSILGLSFQCLDFLGCVFNAEMNWSCESWTRFSLPVILTSNKERLILAWLCALAWLQCAKASTR